MPTLSQYIMQVDQQNKKNAQQLVQQLQPIQQAMIQQRINYETKLEKAALQQQKIALEEQKRQQMLQDTATMAKYRQELSDQSFAERKKIEATQPLTPYQQKNIELRQETLNLAKNKSIQETTGQPKQVDKAISKAQSEYSKANNELENFKKANLVERLQGGYLKITGNDGKLYIFDRNRNKYYKSSGFGEPIKKEVDPKLVLSKDTGLAEKVDKYLSIESKVIQAANEYKSLKGGKTPQQKTQQVPQQRVTNWDQFKG